MRNLILIAALSLGVGAGATYATVHVTATCTQASTPAQDTQVKQFLAPPDQRMTGYARY